MDARANAKELLKRLQQLQDRHIAEALRFSEDDGPIPDSVTNKIIATDRVISIVKGHMKSSAVNVGSMIG